MKPFKASLLIMFLILGLVACQKKTSSKGSDGASDRTNGSSLPETPTTGGLLILNFPDDQNPESLSGYVVGHQDDLTVQKTTDGQYYIDNVPPGQQDVILTGKLAIATSNLFGNSNSEDSDRGIRLNKVRIVKGERASEFVSEFPKFGQIKGVAKLAGKTEHSGILVYIPGTQYEAHTDESGTFSIPDVVQGLHNLYFEKDGYYRGRIEQLSVRGEIENVAPSVELILSTGAAGKIVTSQNQKIFTTMDVPLNIVADDSTVLMRFSEDPNFVSSIWQPLQSTLIYRFTSQGTRKLYVEFADANGLVTGPFEIEITINLFPDSSGGIKLSNNLATSFTELVDLSITVPPNADQMMLATNSLFEGASWESVATKKTFYLGYSPSDRQVFVKFRTKELVESQSWSATISIPRNNWTKIVGGSSTSIGLINANIQTGNSVLIVGSVTGSFQGISAVGATDIFIIKVDWDGNIAWSKLIGSTANDYPYAATVDNDGDIYIVGETHGVFMGQTPQNTGDSFVTKLSKDGDHVWTHLLSTSGKLTRATTVVTTDTMVIVGWTDTGTSTGNRLTKFDLNGNQLSSISCGTTNGNLLLGISNKKDKLFVVWDSGSQTNLKGLSISGNVLWQKSIGSTEGQVNSLIIDDSDEIVLGETRIFAVGNASGSVVSKWNFDGEQLFRHFIAPYSSSQNWMSAVEISLDGDIYGTGTTYGSLTQEEISQATTADVFVTRLSSDGDVKYIRLVGSTNQILSGGIVFNPTKGIMITGAITDAVFDNITNPGSSSLLIKTLGP